jgi:hypothetical protein
MVQVMSMRRGLVRSVHDDCVGNGWKFKGRRLTGAGRALRSRDGIVLLKLCNTAGKRRDLVLVRVDVAVEEFGHGSHDSVVLVDIHWR